MFGFVNVYKNELKIKDYNLFKSYYCGLCKSLGKKHNQLVRLGLSYDLTFLAILGDALSEDEPFIEKDGCIKHIGNHLICTKNNAIDYAADMSILLYYYKLCDDVYDDKSIKAFILRIPYIRAVKKVSKKYPEISKSVKNNLKELSRLEKEKCPSLDAVAHPFARLTSDIFSGFSPELKKLGYSIGRLIYIADAYKDIEEDKKKGRYNPFLYYDNEYTQNLDFEKRAMGSFNMNLSAVARAYNELKIKKNKEILDNIIYLGIRYLVEQLFRNNGGKK
ncbi:MAG: hypothetical protein J6V03_05390 [Clostridia bacterium]|nr:hypothetical protein [Clostridia bacterium]